MRLFTQSSPLQTNIGTTLGTRLRRCPESGPCNASLQGATDRQEAAPLAVTRGAVTKAGSGFKSQGPDKARNVP